jgi:hypothetical protein
VGVNRLETILLALERGLTRIARRKWLVILGAGATSLAVRALLIPVVPIPKPAIQDEFSYLLASDTFASGRITNPAPPFAEHFETPQVIVRPTYASKYPPLSGLVMAPAQKLFGTPWIGVWLSMGVMCATLCWALQGWLPPLWAFVGGMLALLRIGLVSYWSEGYWGGSCAAIGGALLIGACPRLLRRPGPGPALAFAAGLAILANTRPYEGLVLAGACLGYLCCASPRFGIGLLRPRVLLPIILLLAPVGACMAYYNYRVTGHALRLPYLEHESQYVVWSPLLLETQPKAPPAYSSSGLRDFWLLADRHEKEYAREHLLRAHVYDLVQLGRFFLGWTPIACAIGFALPLWKNRASRSALLLAAAFYAGIALDARLFPHYAAPATALGYILAASALRTARTAWPGMPAERLLVAWGIVGLCVLTTAMGLFTTRSRFLFGEHDFHIRAKQASVAEQLRNEPGQHLVLVSYGAHHNLYEEFVYNRADLDRAKIVWARSLGQERDDALVRYYRGRKVWQLKDDGDMELRGSPDQAKGTITNHLRGQYPSRFSVCSKLQP